MNTPSLILKNLLYNKEFARRVFPVLKYEYFEDEEYQKIVKYLKIIYQKYSFIPSISILKSIFNDKVKNISEDMLKNILKKLDEFEKQDKNIDPIEYLIDITEEYFIKRDIFLQLLESIKIISENDNKNFVKIPGLLEKSLRVSLKSKDIGYVYGNNDSVEKQYEYYTEKKTKYETHLLNFNELIGGGFEKKTFNVFLGEPGIGKSRLLIDFGANFIKKGLNVLYVSLELPENAIYQRLDANLLDININELKNITKEYYFNGIEKIKNSLNGQIIIKDYPAESISIYDIENLINNIKIERNIDIDILIIDYLTVMKAAKNIGVNVGNLYVNGKIIANELLSIAKKYNVILITAIHLNRGGWGNLDAKMKDIAESAGVAHGADFMAALTSTEDMRSKRRILFSIIKNRYYDTSDRVKLVVGYDNTRMRHFDVADSINDMFIDKNDDIKLSDFEM